MQNTNINLDEGTSILPIGISGFSQLIEKKKIYVDKSAILYSLVKDDNFYFLSRPRRFGKTLLVNTIESLFKDGLKYFKGLAIENKWTDTTYTVIHLDFSSCTEFNSVEEFKDEFLRLIKDAVLDANLKFPPQNLEDPDSAQARFKRMFNTIGTSSVVLLIDEYDAPLNHCLHNPKLFAQVSAELNRFYMVVKQCSPRLRFLFITGICHYLNEDIFSGLNFMTDVSLDSDYSTLVGFTQEELRKYFKVHIERASAVLGLSFEEVINKMTLHYGGYCFDDTASSHVLSTWSVLNFLRDPKDGFNNYWFDSGGHPAELLKYMDDALQAPSEYGHNKYILANEVGVVSPLDYRSSLSVLLQAGYLTIHDVDEGNHALMLNYPNKEVTLRMRRVYNCALFGQDYCTVLHGSAYSIFEKDPLDEIFSKLNRLFGRIDYQRFPIKDEATLKVIMHLYLKDGGIELEKHNDDKADDNSILEFKAGNKHYLIELKYTKEKDVATRLLDSTTAQIQKCHYVAQGNEANLLCMILVYSAPKKMFTSFERVE